jgi:hypothetical protein
VIEWLATVRLDVVNVAWPPLSDPEPMGEPPSWKFTVPAGVPAPGPTTVTVAVKVTDWPNTDGLAEGATVVVVDAWFTVWLSVEDVLPLKFESPP